VDYVLVIHRAEEGGYWAEIPALDGCFVQGETVEELLREAPEAISSHVQALKADGQPIPEGNGIIIATVKNGWPVKA
jgi:predicted RNase H-like HicB family nuclease